MAKTLLGEILEWSKDRPAWQRDALRRLFTAGEITPTDLEELVAICKSARGLVDEKAARVLAEEHLPVKDEGANPVTLVSITHTRGVNALAPDQTISFGPNLTIVYGQNAAGKSGYTRILKRACRSRHTEEVLGNVLEKTAPLTPEAAIRFREGAEEQIFIWGPDAPASTPLAAVSAFDAHCVPVYLRDKTDVAFRPFGLDVFDKLSAVCGEVRTRLDSEHTRLNAITPRLPALAEGTKAHGLIARITSLTKVDELRRAGTLSAADQRRLRELRDRQRDLQSTDPKQRARELELKAGRSDLLRGHITKLVGALGDAALAVMRSAAEDLRVARETLAVLRRSALTAGLLPKTGEDDWRAMWDTTERFSRVAYPGKKFPVLSAGSVCPFCQQTIEAEAVKRLSHFAEYAASTAQADARKAEAAYSKAVASAKAAVVTPPDIELAVNELAAEDPELEGRLRAVLNEALRVQGEVKATAEGAAYGGPGLVFDVDADLQATAETLRARATSLKSQSTSLEPGLAAELRELEARVALGERLQDVVDEVERQKRLAAYRQSIEDTQTQPITRKSTELTKRLITDQLRQTFKDELIKLDFKHLAVEIQAAGGARGALFHRLVFSNAPSVVVAEVLSEGESRALSLAAFLTELSTANAKSTIVFDDPVSSMDHDWRARIARRLVVEAKDRQVIVFTHDILFLHLLLDESNKEDVACHHQYVRREGQAGISSPELPWIAMPTRERLGTLRNRLQAADKLSRTGDREAYEKDAREIYGLLREAWEHATSEVLLNDVVERYRHRIETQKVRFLHDITKEDCEAVDDAMTETSRWIRGHDHPAADMTPVPGPDDLRKRIEDLDGWFQRIRKRRNR